MSSAPPIPEANTTFGGGGTVLVVEDNAFNRFHIRRIVTDLGYVIAECADGAGALRLARERAPDVVLIDVELPDIDGFTFCRRLKDDPVTADTLAIMVTARSDIADIERGFEAGALDYIRKPFHPRELAARLRNAMELKRRGDALRKWKDRTSRELALAATLQQTMQAGRTFLHEKLRVHTAYRPSTEVGGDFFDMLPLPNGRLALYVGDVAGHGVGPAMVATLLKSSLADLLTARAEAGPAAICNALHARFLDQVALPQMFATLFLLVMDLETGAARGLSCGHPAPIVTGATRLKRQDLDRRGGPPVGLSLAPPVPYSTDDETAFTIPPGAILLFVTDGLLEASQARPRGPEGRPLLAKLLEEWRTGGEETAVDHVIRRMRERGYGIDADDCTAMACEFVATDEIALAETFPLEQQALQQTTRRIEESLRATGWSEEAAWAVALLALEHLTNVINHGRAPTGSHGTVQVRLVRSDCELLITDPGRPWDYPEARGDELPREGTESGRGLYIIRRIARRIAHCRHDSRNFTVFTIRKNWRHEP